jgi:hypothetical protein
MRFLLGDKFQRNDRFDIFFGRSRASKIQGSPYITPAGLARGQSA